MEHVCHLWQLHEPSFAGTVPVLPGPKPQQEVPALSKAGRINPSRSMACEACQTGKVLAGGLAALKSPNEHMVRIKSWQRHWDTLIALCIPNVDGR